MKTLFLIIAFSFIFGSLYAQDEVHKNSSRSVNRKNSVYVAQDFFLTLSINYERLFPLNEKMNLGLRGGLGRDGGNKDNTAIVGTIFLYGKSKHFFEAGIAYQQPNLFEKDGSDNPKLAIMGGYRYQSLRGFMFKVYPEFLPDFWPDEDSWGSIPFLGFALGYSF